MGALGRDHARRFRRPRSTGRDATRALILLAALAACNDPPFALRFRVASGPAGACIGDNGAKLSSCSDVTMLCPAVVSIRIFNPADSTAPYISVCKELSGMPNLCAIAGVDLPQPATPVPEQTLEVEMVVYPYDPSMKDPNTGELTCPTGVQFDATGFPVASVDPCPAGDPNSCPPTPAIGGIAFYHPGDAETVVDLGCTDLAQLNAATCSGHKRISVTASVVDFDTGVTVSSSLANHLAVAIDEPVSMIVGTETHYEYDLGAAHPLARTTSMQPSWSGAVDATFMNDYCVSVFEDSAASTTTLSCEAVTDSKTMTIGTRGVRLAKTTLDQVLGALGSAQFPANGLVVGIVLDYLGNPVANQIVTATGGTVLYLSSDRKNLIGGGTSSSGIFLSTDAPFGTTFTASTALQTATAFGGLVDQKVTIVILQYGTPAGM